MNSNEEKDREIKNLNTEEVVLIEAARFLDGKKAEDIELLDLREVSSYLNWFLIASALSSLHVRNLSNMIISFMKEKGFSLYHQNERDADSGWIILDFGDFIIHIFSKEKREFYKIEEAWQNAGQIQWQ